MGPRRSLGCCRIVLRGDCGTLVPFSSSLSLLGLRVGSFAQPHTPVMVFYHRPEQAWAETSKPISPNNPFLFISRFTQIPYYSDRKLTNIASDTHGSWRLWSRKHIWTEHQNNRKSPLSSEGSTETG
jgi:hypothetical protein